MENDTSIDPIFESKQGDGISPRENVLEFVNMMLLCTMFSLLVFGGVLFYFFCLKKSVSCPKCTCMFGHSGRPQHQDDGLPSMAESQRALRHNQLTGMAAACRHYLNNRASTSVSKEVAIQTEEKGVKGSKQSHPEDDMTSTASMEDIPLDDMVENNIYSFSSSHSVNSVVQIHIPSVDQCNLPLTRVQSEMPLVVPASPTYDNTKLYERPIPRSAIDLSLIPSWYLKQANYDIELPTGTCRLIDCHNNNISIEDMNLADGITDTPVGILGAEEQEPENTEENGGSVSCPEHELAQNGSDSSQVAHQDYERVYSPSVYECLAKLKKVVDDGIAKAVDNMIAANGPLSAHTITLLKDLKKKREERSQQNHLEKEMPSRAFDNVIYENISFTDVKDAVRKVYIPEIDNPPITRAQSAMPLIISTYNNTNVPEMYQRPFPTSAHDISLVPPFYPAQNDNGSHMATGASGPVFPQNINIVAKFDNLAVGGALEGVLGNEKPEETADKPEESGSVSCPEHELAQNGSDSSQVIHQHYGRVYSPSAYEIVAKLQKLMDDMIAKAVDNMIAANEPLSAHTISLLKDLKKKREERSQQNHLEKEMPSRAFDNVIYENISFTDVKDAVRKVCTPEIDNPPITRAQSAMPLIISTYNNTNVPEMYQRPLPTSVHDISLVPPLWPAQNDNGSHMATGASGPVLPRNNNIVANYENLAVGGTLEGVLGTEKPEETAEKPKESGNSAIEDSEYPYV